MGEMLFEEGTTLCKFDTGDLFAKQQEKDFFK